MLVLSGLLLVISIQLATFLLPAEQAPIYQTRSESAKIASKEVLAEKVTPTSTPVPTATPTPSPTVTPQPKNNSDTSTQVQNNQASPSNQTTILTPTQPPSNSNSSGNWQSIMMGQINSFRSSKGLSSLSTNSETCSFARTRASEIDSSLSHDGFRNRLSSNTLPYPSFSSVAENLAWHYDYTKVVQGWIDSSGHNENLSKDVPYACVERNGDLYVFEAWKP